MFSQTLAYDPASNVTSLATTQAAVPGASGSGRSESQNFCYDEQNRLVWAGNSGTQPGAGNGTSSQKQYLYCTTQPHELTGIYSSGATCSTKTTLVYGSSYDAWGTRVLRRTTTGSGTTMRVYAFGLEQHTYAANGSHTSDLYYYSLAGRLLGSLDTSTNTTGFYLTDTLGSVLASFSNTDKSAVINGNQVFGPYGNYGYHQGRSTPPRALPGSTTTA